MNANAVQQKITDKARDEVIEGYYETAVKHFTRLNVEWRRLQRDQSEKEQGVKEAVKKNDESTSIGNAVSKFISKKVWNFSEVNY